MRNFNDFPFSPRRVPFFYGWVIVFVSTLGMLSSIPGQTMGVSVFTDELLAAIPALNRVDLTGAYMYGTCASGLILPFAGLLLDRLGARLMVVLASISLAASTLLLSQCDRVTRQVGHFLGQEGSSSAVAILVLSLGFFMLRFWGQGVLTTISRTTLGRWFQRRRGLAAGISGVFVTSTFAAAPQFLAGLVEHQKSVHGPEEGWRGALITLGLVIGIGMSILGWLLYRDRPEDCGLQMDGAPPTDAGGDPQEPGADPDAASGVGPNPASRHEYTLVEAVRTYPFWVFSCALALSALIHTAFTFHIGSFGKSANLDLKEAVSIFVPLAMCSVVANLIAGWLSDRVRIKYLLWAQLISLSFGTLCMLEFGTALGRVGVILGFGVQSGLWAVIMAVVWPRFYGRRHLGTIGGVCMSIVVIASAIGPRLFAEAEHRFETYTAAIWVSAALCGLVFIASLGLRNPQLD